MCPACIASAAWLIAGTASAGGVTAVAVRRLLRRRRASAEPRWASSSDPAQTPSHSKDMTPLQEVAA